MLNYSSFEEGCWRSPSKICEIGTIFNTKVRHKTSGQINNKSRNKCGETLLIKCFFHFVPWKGTFETRCLGHSAYYKGDVIYEKSYEKQTYEVL